VIKNDPAELKLHSEKLYGIYRGVIVDNDDSREWKDENGRARFVGGTGRVRVRIWGIHTPEEEKKEKEGIPQDEIPWAQPAYPIIEGSLTDIGFWSVPIKGTHVFVFFENGDYMQPRYFSLAPGIQPESIKPADENGFVKKEWLPKPQRLGEPDISRVARGQKEDTFIERISNEEVHFNVGYCDAEVGKIPRNAEIGSYPNITSLETRHGHALTFDPSTIYLYHSPSNNNITMDGGGIILHAIGELLNLIKGSIRTITSGEEVKKITGNSDQKFGANLVIDVKGDINITGPTIYIGDCSYVGYHLATDQHRHSGVEPGGSLTGLPCGAKSITNNLTSSAS
jgi:hypothetical protein